MAKLNWANRKRSLRDRAFLAAVPVFSNLDDYQKKLDVNGITCSMSRRGDCYDNAVSHASTG